MEVGVRMDRRIPPPLKIPLFPAFRHVLSALKPSTVTLVCWHTNASMGGGLKSTYEERSSLISQLKASLTPFSPNPLLICSSPREPPHSAVLPPTGSPLRQHLLHTPLLPIWSPVPRTGGCGPTHLLCNTVDNHQVSSKILAGGGRGFPAAQGSGEEVAASLEELPVPGTGPAQASYKARTELSGWVLFSPLPWTLQSRAGLPSQLSTPSSQNPDHSPCALSCLPQWETQKVDANPSDDPLLCPNSGPGASPREALS